MKYKIIFPTICILSLGLLVGCDKKEASSYQQGVAAIANHDYDTAVTLLGRSVSEGANLKSAYRAEGIAYMAKGDYDKAISLFEDALHESNGIIENMDIDIAYYLAVAQYRGGQPQEALATLDSVVAVRPTSDTAMYLKGKINLIRGNKEEAIQNYEKTVELAPSNYEHYIRICEDLRDAGYKSEGDVYIERAMGIGGKMTDAVKGELNYYRGAYTDARNDLENARKSNDNEMISLFLGRTYEALGDIDFAMGIYQEAINKFPDSGKMYNQLALSKINQKDYKGAVEVIEQGIENGNGDALQGLMFNRVVAYENLCDFQKAAECMKEYIEKYPGDEKAEREYIFLSTR